MVKIFSNNTLGWASFFISAIIPAFPSIFLDFNASIKFLIGGDSVILFSKFFLKINSLIALPLIFYIELFFKNICHEFDTFTNLFKTDLAVPPSIDCFDNSMPSFMFVTLPSMYKAAEEFKRTISL